MFPNLTVYARRALVWFAVGLMSLFIGLVVVHWTSPTAGWLPIAGFLGTLVGILCFYFACGFAITNTALGVFRDGENTYSLSRLQMAGWTWLILSALIAIAVSRLWHPATGGAGGLNIYIPSNLFIVMGISFFTGAAAPSLLSLKTSTPATPGQVQTARTRMSETDVVANGQVIVRDLSQAPHWGDIVEGDDVATKGTVDISKVQQLLITALLMGVYFAMLWDLFESSDSNGLLWAMSPSLAKSLVNQNSLLCGYQNVQDALAGKCGIGWTAMPDFPAALVTLLAVSHGGYLAYKAVPRTAADNSGSTAARPAAGAATPVG